MIALRNPEIRTGIRPEGNCSVLQWLSVIENQEALRARRVSTLYLVVDVLDRLFADRNLVDEGMVAGARKQLVPPRCAGEFRQGGGEIPREPFDSCL